MSKIVINQPTPENRQVQVYQFYLLQHRLLTSLQEIIEAILKKSKLSFNEWLLLSAIKDTGRQTVSMRSHASLLNLDLPRITEITNRLIARRLVKQKDNKDDHRKKYLVCTISGRRMVKKLREDIEIEVSAWRRPMGQDQFDAYLRLLAKLSK